MAREYRLKKQELQVESILRPAILAFSTCTEKLRAAVGGKQSQLHMFQINTEVLFSFVQCLFGT